MIRDFLALPLAAVAVAPASAQTFPSSDRVAGALAVSEATPQPGCAVGIFRAGKSAQRINAGYADLEARLPIRSDTQFYAASVAKHFTAVAVMQQVVAGRIRLDEDIRAYIPELPRYPHPVTVQMLLNMTGGIRDSLSLLGLEGYDNLSQSSRALGLAGVYRQPDTKFEPGTRYDYSNGNYLLLSEAVERVSGMPFETYMNARILRPLGMTRSVVMLGSRPADANLAKGYVARDGSVTSSNEYPLFGGSGGLVTTIDDLGKWAADIDSGHKVWTSEITRLMTQAGTFKDGSPALRGGYGAVYGNGLLIGPHWFHHTGGAGGFKTLFGYNAGKRTAVALLCNNGDYDPNVKADAVVAALEEGLPAISEPTRPIQSLNGRYRSANLAATYDLSALNDGITLVARRGDGRTGTPMQFKRMQGVFRSGPNELTIDDDGAGFTLSIPRVALHFDKVK